MQPPSSNEQKIHVHKKIREKDLVVEINERKESGQEVEEHYLTCTHSPL